MITLPFRNRAHAARLLAERMERFRGRRPLVLAIPRGAVPMGRLLADHLDGDLDIVLVRKLGAPFSEELAVGAVDESGRVYIAPLAEAAGASPEYLQREVARQREAIAQRRKQYAGGTTPLDPHGRLTIVIDDGLATGATMIAALRAVRAHEPRWLVCAAPVASQDALDAVSAYADEVIFLATPYDFEGVGQFYIDFEQVDDDAVAAALAVSSHPQTPLARHVAGK